MKRIMATAALSAVGVLALAGTASADIGDIDRLSLDQQLSGTAETVEVSGTIRCTTTIEYGLVAVVAQDPAEGDVFGSDPETGEPGGDADVEGVGAFGPNQGNEANSPCTTNIQDYEVTVQRNRDSGTFQTGDMAAAVVAGTSAENGDRGPGPFIGDILSTADTIDFQRSDP
jgi:hypothetical protein